MFHFPLFFLNTQSSIPLSHKCITGIMAACKCWEKHNPTIAHFCLLTTLSACLPHSSFTIFVLALPRSLNYSFSSNFTHAPLQCLYPLFQPTWPFYLVHALQLMCSNSYVCLPLHNLESFHLLIVHPYFITAPSTTRFPFPSYSFWFFFFLSLSFFFLTPK